jgi:hypothetical protein
MSGKTSFFKTTSHVTGWLFILGIRIFSLQNKPGDSLSERTNYRQAFIQW